MKGLFAKYVCKQRLINIYYILFTQNCYTVYKHWCIKYFFSFYSGQQILLCDKRLSARVVFMLTLSYK